MPSKYIYVIWDRSTKKIIENRSDFERMTRHSSAHTESFTDREDAEKALTMTYQEWIEYKRKRAFAQAPPLW